MSGHPIAATVWLGLCFGGIGYGAYSAQTANNARFAEIEAAQVAALDQVLAEIRMAIEGGDLETGYLRLEALPKQYPGRTSKIEAFAKQMEPVARRVRAQLAMQAAMLLAESGNPEAAVDQLKKLVDQYPDFKGIRFNLAIALRAARKLDEADAQFAALETKDDWDLVAERATILKLRGKVDESLALLDTIPAGSARIPQRFGTEEWSDLLEDPRVRALLEKHGQDLGDTSIRAIEELERQKQGQ